jgi:predicted signal transduction protein with EAL and GGDEF domain
MLANDIDEVARKMADMKSHRVRCSLDVFDAGRFLADMGCTRYHGYFFARPLPSADVDAFVATADAEARAAHGAPLDAWRRASAAAHA